MRAARCTAGPQSRQSRRGGRRRGRSRAPPLRAARPDCPGSNDEPRRQGARQVGLRRHEHRPRLRAGSPARHRTAAIRSMVASSKVVSARSRPARGSPRTSAVAGSGGEADDHVDHVVVLGRWQSPLGVLPADVDEVPTVDGVDAAELTAATVVPQTPFFIKADRTPHRRRSAVSRLPEGPLRGGCGLRTAQGDY
jgi:hypothetical protein